MQSSPPTMGLWKVCLWGGITSRGTRIPKSPVQEKPTYLSTRPFGMHCTSMEPHVCRSWLLNRCQTLLTDPQQSTAVSKACSHTRPIGDVSSGKQAQTDHRVFFNTSSQSSGRKLAAPSLRCDGQGVCRRQELGGRWEQAPDATLVHLGEKTEPGFYNRRTGCSPAGDPVLSRPQRPRIVGQSPIGDILPGQPEGRPYVPGIADLLP